VSQSSDSIEDTVEQVADTSNSLDLEGQEKNAIMQALEKTRWNKTAAAKLLGLSLRQLRYRLQKFGIE
jgi:two-component system response regulator PilR (NtrC family)